MVVELKASARTKGDLIDDFMSESPFRGRQPVFVGDDVTDEGGFNEVNGRSGLSIRIGPPAPLSPAAARLDSPADLRRWLADAWAVPALHPNKKTGGGDEHS